jgi:hypothetical protein
MAHVVLIMLGTGAAIIVALCFKEMLDWFKHGR